MKVYTTETVGFGDISTIPPVVIHIKYAPHNSKYIENGTVSRIRLIVTSTIIWTYDEMVRPRPN